MAIKITLLSTLMPLKLGWKDGEHSGEAIYFLDFFNGKVYDSNLVEASDLSDAVMTAVKNNVSTTNLPEDAEQELEAAQAAAVEREAAAKSEVEERVATEQLKREREQLERDSDERDAD